MRTWLREYSTAMAVVSASLTTGLVLAACASFINEPPGISYAKAVQDLGIYPVYPPREDIQVGDIYGMENDHSVEQVRRRSVYVTTKDMTADIKNYLKKRYEFGTTGTGNASYALSGFSNQIPQQTDAPSDGEVLDRADLQNLPITDFPAIEVDSGLSLGVAGAAQSLAAIFGFEAAKTLKMTLHFGLVTTYQVPIPIAYRALIDYCRPAVDPRDGRKHLPSDCAPNILASYIDQKFQLPTDPAKGGVKNVIPIMVSKVYLARAISYTFNDSTLAAAAAAVAEGNGTTAPGVIGGNLLGDAVAANDASMVSALAAFQTALNGATSKADTSGVSVSVQGYTKSSVTFQEIYERPVVVGYEAVYIDPRTTYTKEDYQ